MVRRISNFRRLGWTGLSASYTLHRGAATGCQGLTLFFTLRSVSQAPIYHLSEHRHLRAIRLVCAPRHCQQRPVHASLPFAHTALQQLVFGWGLFDHVGHPCVPERSANPMVGGSGRGSVPAGFYLRPVVRSVMLHLFLVQIGHTDQTPCHDSLPTGSGLH